MKEAERLTVELLLAIKTGDVYSAVQISGKLATLLNTYKVSC